MGSTGSLDAMTPADKPRPHRARLWILFLVLVSSILSCDLVSKRAASAELQQEPSRYYLGGIVELIYAENEGALLGLGQSLSPRSRFWILSAGGVLLLAILFLVLCFRGFSSSTELFGWALLFGGGIGNLADRLARDGAVVDFLRLSVGSIRTAIFNLADVAIVAGVVLLVFGSRSSTGVSEQSETVAQGDTDSRESDPEPFGNLQS